jgi:hypothetical protein
MGNDTERTGDHSSLTSNGSLHTHSERKDGNLPVQGLDYWARVRQHHRAGDFQRYGYFPGRILSERDPILILAAPALHVHPSTATMLRYFPPELEWKLVGLDERWRDGIRVIFNKQREQTE